MIDIAPAFARSTIPKLMDDAPHQGGFKQWLLEGSYSVELDGTPPTLKLIRVAPSEILRFLLFDYSRFALSSVESIAKSYGEIFDAKAIAWRLLNQYYSAFFAAHALLRATGGGVVRMEKKEAKHLQKIVQATLDPKFSLEAGTFCISLEVFNEFDATLSIKKLATGSGGAHAEFWIFFSKHLSSLSKSVLEEGRPEAAGIIGRIDELHRILSGPEQTAKGSWLSIIRNEINYQHKFGAWFPFQTAKALRLPEANVLKQNSSAISLTVNPKTSPIEAFCHANNFIAILNIDVAQILKGRGGKGAAQFSKEWNHLIGKLKIQR